MRKRLLALGLYFLTMPAFAAGGKTFVFHNAIRDLDEFRALSARPGRRGFRVALTTAVK